MGAAVGGGPAAPLVAVDGAEVPIGIRPFVPDFDAVLAEVGNVGIALQEPEELMNDALQVQLLRGNHGEAGGQVKAHLVAEDGGSARARTVAFVGAGVEDVAEKA